MKKLTKYESEYGIFSNTPGKILVCTPFCDCVLLPKIKLVTNQWRIAIANLQKKQLNSKELLGYGQASEVNNLSRNHHQLCGNIDSRRVNLADWHIAQGRRFCDSIGCNYLSQMKGFWLEMLVEEAKADQKHHIWKMIRD